MRRGLATALVLGLFMGVSGCGDSDVGIPEQAEPAKPIDMSTKIGKMGDMMKQDKQKPAPSTPQPVPKN